MVVLGKEGGASGREWRTEDMVVGGAVGEQVEGYGRCRIAVGLLVSGSRIERYKAAVGEPGRGEGVWVVQEASREDFGTTTGGKDGWAIEHEVGDLKLDGIRGCWMVELTATAMVIGDAPVLVRSQVSFEWHAFGGRRQRKFGVSAELPRVEGLRFMNFFLPSSGTRRIQLKRA